MGTRTFVNNRLSFSPAKNVAHGVDIPLVLTVVALAVFGLIMLYCSRPRLDSVRFDCPVLRIWLGSRMLKTSEEVLDFYVPTAPFHPLSAD